MRGVVVLLLVLHAATAQHCILHSPKQGAIYAERDVRVEYEVRDYYPEIHGNITLLHENNVIESTQATIGSFVIQLQAGEHSLILATEYHEANTQFSSIAWFQCGVTELTMPQHMEEEPIPLEINSTAFNQSRWQPTTRTASQVLRDYAILHAKIMDPANDEVQKRYLVSEYSGFGLGNRINGWMTALMMAIMTQRALLVEMREAHKFFDDSSRANEPSIRWNYNTMDEIQALLPYDVEEAWDFGAMDVRMVENTVCGAFNETLRNEAIVVVRTNQWGGPFFASNPYYRQWIYQMFGQNVSTHLMNFMLRPAPDVQAAIDNVKADWKGRFTIALQIRRHVTADKHDHPCRSATIISKYSQQPQFTRAYITDDDEQIMWECGKSLGRAALQSVLHTHPPGARKPLYYIATDTKDETHPVAIDKLGKDNVYAIDVPTNSFFDGDDTIMFWAIVEMWAMGEAHDLIITPGSTYGYWAAARSGRPPLTMTKWGKCLRPLSPEPFPSQWRLLKHTSCFTKRMHVPEFDMLCPSCAYQECLCPSVPCASHSDRTVEFSPFL